jgi:acetyltransferase-like isoleucine patch superfamily enzyme
VNLNQKYSKDLSGWFFDRLFIHSNKFRISLFGWLYKSILSFKGVKFGTDLILNGAPVVHRVQGSEIILGNMCTLNSAKKSAIIRIYAPCRLITNRREAKIIFGNNSGATSSLFVAISQINIGNNVMIGANCTIIDNDFHHTNPNNRNKDDYKGRPINIEDNVFIGFNCVILKGVTIGENSIIGANSVVINSIPKNSIAIGNPCKVIITRKW